MKPRVIYLRTESDSLHDALRRAAEDHDYSVNVYAQVILEQHLRAAGYLE
jgi:hypothetical protein